MNNTFIVKKKIFTLFFSLVAFTLVIAGNGVPTLNSGFGPDVKGTKNFLRYSSSLNALNVKVMPAFYWSSIGAEIEYPVSDAFTVGLNILGKIGRTDGKNVVFKIRPESTQESAYRLELAAKYYLGKSAPIGFYGQFNLSYGNLLFFDGTNRPYTMHSKWKKFNDDKRAPTLVEQPKDYSVGLGAGYQLIVIPKKIIANIMVGTQLYLEQTSGMYPAFYISPSLGYVF